LADLPYVLIWVVYI